MSIKIGSKLLSGVANQTVKNSRHLLEPFWSDHILNDLDCLRADTFSWQSGDVYVSAFNHLVNDVQGVSLESEYAYSNVRHEGYAMDHQGVCSNYIGYWDENFQTQLSDNVTFLPFSFPWGGSNESWEFVIKAKTPKNFGSTSTGDPFNRCLVNSNKEFSLSINVLPDGRVGVWLSSNGTSWNMSTPPSGADPTYPDGTISTKTVSANTVYFFRLRYVLNGNTIDLDVSADNGFSWENYVKVQNTTVHTNVSFPVLGGQRITLTGHNGVTRTVVVNPWEGLYYLDGCYFKQGDTVVWTGTTNINFYRAQDGHKICPYSEMDKVNNLYEKTGVAWYYVLHASDPAKRFKLPRTKYGFTGYRDNSGDLVPESLPSISGMWAGGVGYTPTNGALSIYARNQIPTLSNGWTSADIYNANSQVIQFNASRSTVAYQDGAPVQPRATQMYLYFYVGEFSSSASEQTAGITSEQLNNKLNLPLDNLPNVQQINIIARRGLTSLSFPCTNSDKYSYFNMNLTTTGTDSDGRDYCVVSNQVLKFTAQRSGWVSVNIQLTAGCWAILGSFPLITSNISQALQSLQLADTSTNALSSGFYQTLTIPVADFGQNVYFASNSCWVYAGVFIPAEGSKNLAAGTEDWYLVTTP